MSNNKRLCFVGICIFVLGCGLFIYPYIAEPITLENYQVTKVKYQKVYFDKNGENVVLVSGDRKFNISNPIVNNIEETSCCEIVEKLKLSSEAKIWFAESFRGTFLVKGIKTDNYYYTPSKSVIYDNDTRVFTGVGILFLVFGGVAVLLTVFTAYVGYEKYQWY